MNPVNSYDSHAETRAKEFAKNKNLVHAYIEKPAMYGLLPDLSHKSVLCVGCGTGEECIELHSRGANVTGFDISPSSISYAAKNVTGVTFKTFDMDSSDIIKTFGADKFDLIYSSLTLHYSNDLGQLLKNLNTLLKPKGCLLFSVGHPLRWAAQVNQDVNDKSVLMGYRQSHNQLEIFGDYLGTRQFTQKLSDGPEVTYWMRPISAYFKLLQNSGFTVLKFEEPSPLEVSQDVDENFWKLRTKLPVDMIFLAQKN